MERHEKKQDGEWQTKPRQIKITKIITSIEANREIENRVERRR